MNPGLQTYDIWQRDWVRLLAGSIFLSFGLVFGWIFFREPEIAFTSKFGMWATYALVILCCGSGAFILCFRQLVFIDSERGELSKVTYLFYIAVHKRTLAFTDLREVQALHRSDDGGYACWVGILPVSGGIIWLRTFNSPETGPSEESQAFAQGVAAATRLKLEVRSKSWDPRIKAKS